VILRIYLTIKILCYTKLHITNNELIVLDVDGNTYMRKEFRKAITGDGKEELLQLMR
jgi:hypothetical protein